MSRYFAGLGLLAITLLSLGCGPKSEPPGTSIADDHDHAHEHATTFEGAVKELVELRDKVRDGIAADDESMYHEPLHEVGHVLENIKKLAGDLDEESKAKATEAVDKLFDAFEKVDAKFHGEAGVEYSDVSAEIDASIATLEGLASSPAESAAGGDEAQGGETPPTEKEAPPVPPVDGTEK